MQQGVMGSEEVVCSVVQPPMDDTVPALPNDSLGMSLNSANGDVPSPPAQEKTAPTYDQVRMLFLMYMSLCMYSFLLPVAFVRDFRIFICKFLKVLPTSTSKICTITILQKLIVLFPLHKEIYCHELLHVHKSNIMHYSLLSYLL